MLKQITIIALLFFVTASTSNAQKLKGLKDKMKDKINAVTGKDSTKLNSTGEIDTESQDVILATHETGEYNQYYGPNKLYSYKSDLVIVKNDDGNAKEFYFKKDKSLGKKYIFKPRTYNGSDHIFAFGRARDKIQISCSKTRIFAYRGYNDKESEHGYKVEKMIYVHGPFMKPKDAIVYIEKQRGASLKQIEADRKALNDAEKERRKKYTLEGKKIKLIVPEWIDKPAVNGVLANSSYNLGFKVTFEDGTEDKTLNLGGNLYACDFKVETTNATKSNFDSEYKTWDYGLVSKSASIKVREPKNGAIDEVKLIISNKFGGSYSLEIKLPIAYPTKGELLIGGQPALGGTIMSSGGGRGGHGMHVKVELKSYKHSYNNKTVYIYKYTNIITGKINYGRFTGKGLHIDASGGAGGSGGVGSDSWDHKKPTKGGPGGNGGNGGKITLIVDASASGVLITHDVSGGNGGNGGRGGMSHGDCPYDDGPRGNSGNSGSEGSYSKKSGKVNF